MKAVVLLSGGLDSYTAAAIAAADGYELYALTIRYGQVHAREIEAARRVAAAVRVVVQDCRPVSSLPPARATPTTPTATSSPAAPSWQPAETVGPDLNGSVIGFSPTESGVRLPARKTFFFNPSSIPVIVPRNPSMLTHLFQQEIH